MKAHIALLLVMSAGSALAQDVVPGVSLPQADREASQSCMPNYPAISKRNGQQGTVRVRVFVGAAGIVSKIEILTYSGHPSLDQAAMDYAQCIKFKPGMLDGLPVATWHEIPVTFQMEVSSPSP